MQKSFIQLDDGKMAYLAGGKGKNLILLHSLNLSSDSWEKVFGELAQSFTVHALDMFGHGDSERPARNFLIEDYAGSVIQFMERMNVEKAVICGNSVGALIAVELGAAFPQKVEKLVLVGCPARDPWERMERLALSALGFDPQGNPQPLSLTELKMTFARPTPGLTAWFNKLRAKAGVWVKKTMIAISLYDPFPRFAQIHCPTLVLFGSQDILKEKEKEILHGIKGSKSVILPEAGHVPQMDRPEAFLKAIDPFLKQG